MQHFHIHCRCGSSLSVPEPLLGRAVQCGHCDAVHRLVTAGPITKPALGVAVPMHFVGRLTIESGPSRVGETIFLGGERPIQIGKIPGKQIILPGERVSRNHCKLTLTGQSWWIEDQGSTNGVHVNGHRVGSANLNHGDRVHIGDFDLIYLESFEVAQGEAAPTHDDMAGLGETIAGTVAPHAQPVAQEARKTAPSEKPARAPKPAEANAFAAPPPPPAPPAPPEPPAPPVFEPMPEAPAPVEDGLAELASLLESPQASDPFAASAGAGKSAGISNFVGDESAIGGKPDDALASKSTDGQAEESYELNDLSNLEAPAGTAAASGGASGGGNPLLAASAASIAGSAAAGDPLSAAPITGEGPICPSCDKRLKRNAKICAGCGIHIDTGRSLLTARELNLNQIYDNTEATVKLIRWFIWVGFYPVASEAYGSRKPYTIHAITLLTILVSVWFYGLHLASSPQLVWAKNLMLWAGGAPPKAQQIAIYYEQGFGDNKALAAKLQEQAGFKTSAGHAKPAPVSAADSAMPEASAQDSTSPGAETIEDELAFGLFSQASGAELIAADKALPQDQRAIGQFHLYQLLTHALLHGGLLHLVGNLLFMLVFGSRVNAIIGNIATPIVYPVLAIAGAVGHLIDSANDAPMPMIGASGAIMGLAGMYLILVPGFKVHCVAWAWAGLFSAFKMAMKSFPVRGFWVVLFFIAFDVLATLIGSKDGVAHWAHLGGFIAGVVIASGLVFSRLIDTRGGDMYSLLLGKRAWALVGKPSQWSAKREAAAAARAEAEKAKALAKQAASTDDTAATT